MTTVLFHIIEHTGAVADVAHARTEDRMLFKQLPRLFVQVASARRHITLAYVNSVAEALDKPSYDVFSYRT